MGAGGENNCGEAEVQLELVEVWMREVFDSRY